MGPIPPNTSRSPRKTRNWSPPQLFADYQILWSLGRGGMGEVFLGHDKLLERPVAIKFLTAFTPKDNLREQYLTEARAAARLQHPNVVTVYSVGELEGRPYIVSEYLQGQNLDHLHKPVPWLKVLDLGIRLARGLAAAHRAGVLHRDIKPGNAILTDAGELKLLDFGLAKVMERSMPVLVPPVEAKDALAPTFDVVSSSGNHPAVSASSSEVESSFETAGGPPDAAAMNLFTSPDPSPAPRATRKLQGGSLPAARLYENDDQVGPKPVEQAGWASTIQGTPHYMAPEVLLGKHATRASDVYSLGALLFELCAGVTPHYDVPIDKVRELVPLRDAPPLLHVAPSVNPRFAAVIDRCLRRSPAERYISAEEVRTALEQLREAISDRALPEGNPYRGLLPYEPEHHGMFFGRQSEIGTLIERLRSEPCILIAGDPAVGKSSLCRAGVLPHLHERGLTTDRLWKSAVVLPGKTPILSFGRAISTAIGCPEELIEHVMNEEPARLGQTLERVLGPHNGLLLFIDDLETLLTLPDAAEGFALAEAVESLLQGSPAVRVLLAVRQGAIQRLSASPRLAVLVRQPVYDLRPMSADNIKEAILGPVQAKGVRFEPSFLVDGLVEATMASECGLPLLQVVLADLWEARKGNVIDTGSLDAIGGMAGALSRHADHVLGRLTTEQRLGARMLLTALITPEHKPLRHTAAELLALGPDLQPVLDALLAGRVLAVRDGLEGPIYSIASRTLCEGWRTLHKWLEESPSGAVKRVPKSNPPELSRYRTERRNLALTAAPLFLLVLYGVMALFRQHQKDAQIEGLVKQSRERQRSAERKRAAAHRTKIQGLAALAVNRNSDAAELWLQARAESEEAEIEYGTASHALERALNLDGSRADLRAALADILVVRVILTEGEQSPRLRADLLERLALYDDNGERQRRLSGRGRLVIEGTLPGIVARIARIKLNPHHGWELQADELIKNVPPSLIELEPGNYLLTLSAPGYSTIRRPVLIEYSNEVKVNTAMLPVPSVPAMPK